MAEAKVTFRITTYWKRPREQAGLTQMSSQRISISQALDWVLAELPEDAVIIDGGETATIVIDWAKVPMEIRDGRR